MRMLYKSRNLTIHLHDILLITIIFMIIPYFQGKVDWMDVVNDIGDVFLGLLRSRMGLDCD